MDKGLYLRILNALYNAGIGANVDVWPLFDGYFLKPHDDGEAVFHYRYQRFNPILQAMVDNNHIYFKPDTISPLVQRGRNDNWDDQIEVFVAITPGGYEYFDRHLINQSVFGLNGSLIENNKSTSENMKRQTENMDIQTKNTEKQTNIFQGQLLIYKRQLLFIKLSALFSIVSVILAGFTYLATVDASKVSDKIDQLKNTITIQNIQINKLQIDLLKQKSSQKAISVK